LINKGRPEGATRAALPPSAAGVLSPDQPGLGPADPSTTEVVDAEIVGVDPNEY
jgi:hypothetical protein